MSSKRFKAHWKAEEAAERLPSISVRKRIIVVYIFPRITVTGLFLLDNHGITRTPSPSSTDYSGWQINLEVIAIRILIPPFSCLRAQWGLLTARHSSRFLSLPFISLCPRLSCRSAAQQAHSPRLALGSTAKRLNGAQKREWFQRDAVSPSRLVNVFNHRFEGITIRPMTILKLNQR